MQPPKILQTILVVRGDTGILSEELKRLVSKSLRAALIQSDREHRQFLLGQACRYELELIRRGEIGDPKEDKDMLDFFKRFGGGPTSLEVLPNEEEEEAAPPAKFVDIELQDNIYHYECGCVYNLTLRRWDNHCPLFADGTCPQTISRAHIQGTGCTCRWPAHCTKCEKQYVLWWKNQVVKDIQLEGVKRDSLLNEEGRLNSEDAPLDSQEGDFESEGGGRAASEIGSLAESDRRVVSRANSEAMKGDLFIG